MSRMVEIRQGKLRGVEGTYADIYRGIPYAKPPVGELRFHAPEPPEPWEGIYAADTFSCICPQLGQESGSFYEKEFYSDPAFMPPQNEDCLYLNIWTPKSEEPRREEDLCPVAVWFHGGGFINGFGSEIEFDGEAYAKRGIVLVTVNYRLGLLGYFAHPDLTARDGHSGNYGLLDQIAAIDWVRENIAAFGGNPDQITIFGQSAGGMSVRALISSPLMKGKVRGAILQSCGGYHSPLTAAGDAGVLESAAVQFLKEKNMTLEDLCQVPGDQIMPMELAFMGSAYQTTGQMLTLTPVVDGYALTQDCDVTLEKRETLPISYMIGCTKNDIEIPADGVENPMKNALYTSDLEWCRMQRAAGNPCYAYYFTRQLPGDKEGAFHSAELWYMFGTLDRCWRPLTEADQRLSEEMLDCWASFIKTGNPGWEICGGDPAEVKVFDI